jgi:hypothetical protein
MGNWELAGRMMLIGAYIAGGMLAVIVALWLLRITAKAVGRALVLFAVRRMSDSRRLAFYARHRIYKEYHQTASLIEQNEIANYVLARKILARLYEALPLDGVLTDYVGCAQKQGDSVTIRDDYRNPWLHKKLVLDKMVVVNTSTVTDTALDAARKIIKEFPHKWVAFAAMAFVDEKITRIIFGVEMAKTRNGGKHENLR